MMKKTHVTAGITLTAAAAMFLNIAVTPAFIFAAAIGSILSDTDHPSGAINNKLLLRHNNRFKFITYMAIALVLILYGPRYMDIYIVFYIVPILVVISFARHRSVTHSLFGVVGIGIIATLIRSRYGLDFVFPLVFGMATHLLLDMFNPQGVELFWPNKKNYRLPFTFTTGSGEEKMLFIVFAVLLLYICYKSGINIPEIYPYYKQ